MHTSNGVQLLPILPATSGLSKNGIRRAITVVGLTEEEMRGRYDVCLDLVEQLTGYTERKRLQRTDLTLAQLLVEIDRGIRLKDWGLSRVEFDWIMQQLRARFI